MEHAIVIGVSIAGLSQAAVLRRHFQRVTILEADTLDLERPAHRPGVPQDRQVHGLLGRGLANFETFLPGLRNDLIASGVGELEYGRDVFWLMNETWWSQNPTGIKAIGFTRPHLEFHVRRRLFKEKNIAFKGGAAATRYLLDGNRVTGVEITSGGKSEALYADLIVDCTGRHSRTLRGLGHEVPTEEIDLNLYSTTQLIRFAEPQNWKFIYVATAPPHVRRYGAIIKTEGDNYLVGLGGYFGDVTPREPAAMMDFLKTFQSPILAQHYARSIPVEKPQTFRFKSNLRRYFSHCRGLPEGLIFAGDVVCSFDPVFGQGMTAATLSAEVLDRCLRGRDNVDGLARRFHKAQDKMLNEPWMQAVLNDMRFAEVQGKRTPAIRFMMGYSSAVLRAMHLPWVHNRVVPIFNMLKPGAALFSPVLIAAAVLTKLGFIKPDRALPAPIATQVTEEPLEAWIGAASSTAPP